MTRSRPNSLQDYLAKGEFRHACIVGRRFTVADIRLFHVASPGPESAWIDLTPYDNTSLDAVQVDERDWPTAAIRSTARQPRADRALPVPGHTQQYRPGRRALWRDCQVKLSFKDFAAGQRYQLHAGSIGFRPWIKLYDDQQKMVGQGLPAGCQRT